MVKKMSWNTLPQIWIFMHISEKDGSSRHKKKIGGKADPGGIPDWRPSQAEEILALQNCCHLICERWLSTMQFMSDADVSQIATSLNKEATARGKRWKIIWQRTAHKDQFFERGNTRHGTHRVCSLRPKHIQRNSCRIRCSVSVNWVSSLSDIFYFVLLFRVYKNWKKLLYSETEPVC